MEVVWVGNERAAGGVRPPTRDLGVPGARVQSVDVGALAPIVSRGGVDAVCGTMSPADLSAVRAASPDIAIVATGTGDDRRDLALLEAGADEIVTGDVAEGVATALARACARRRSRARTATPAFRRHNVALTAVARRMRACAGAPPREQVRVLTEVSAEALAVARTSVWLFDEARSLIRPFDVYDARTGTHVEAAALSRDDAPAYFDALQEERVIVANDARNDPVTREFATTYLEPLGIGAMLDAPVRVGDQILGVLCHEHIGEPRHFTEEEQSIAAGIADFVALAFEMHERRRAEEGLRKSQAALEQARRVEAVGRLAGGVAHDFNNMLTVILSYADILRRKLGEGNALSPIAAEIARAGHHASDMTRKLLAVSRRDGARPRVFELGPVLADMERFLKRLIGEDVHLVFELSEEPTFVEADPSQIEQVILNLAVNARDAMPEGGELTIATSATKTAVILRVSDTGRGMSADVRARIFEPFFTTKSPGKGTGLGLFTVYGIVRDAGGTISVESEVDAGTTFEIRLPRMPSPESPAPERQAALLRGTETILLVEDEEAVGEVVRTMLAELGYDVMLAHSGEEALALTRERDGTIHQLVADLVMPTLSGPTLARRIRAERPDIAVLFVSGYADETLERYGAASAGAPLLPKPFTREALGAKVREVLSHRTRGAESTP